MLTKLAGKPNPNRRVGGVVRRATEAGINRSVVEDMLRRAKPTIRKDVSSLVSDAGRSLSHPQTAAIVPDLAARLAKYKASLPPVEAVSPTHWAPGAWWDRVVAEAKAAPAMPWVKPQAPAHDIQVNPGKVAPYTFNPSGPPASLMKLLAGGGALAAGYGGIKRMAGGAADAIGNATSGITDTLKSLGETVAPSAPAATGDVGASSSIHSHAPTEGIAGTLWRNAPYLAAGGAGAVGLYALYKNMQAEKERQKQVPSLNLLPKTASDRQAFVDEFPLVAGFLVACHKAGLNEQQFREKIAVVCRLNDDYAIEFATAMEKLGVELHGLPDLTKPLSPEHIAPPPVSVPNAPALGEPGPKLDRAAMQAPMPNAPAPRPAALPQLGGEQPDWIDAENRIHSETPPSGEFSPIPVNMRVNHDNGPSGLENYVSQVKAFYSPWSKEMEQLNSSNDPMGTALRATGRTAGIVGAGAGLAAGGIAAAPAVAAAAPAALTTAGGAALGALRAAPTAARTAVQAVPGAASAAIRSAPNRVMDATRALPAYLKRIPGRVYQYEKAMLPLQIGFQAASPDGMSWNPLQYTTTGQLGMAYYDKLTAPPPPPPPPPPPAAAPMPQERTWKAEDLSPQDLAHVDKQMATTKALLESKYPSADPKWIDEQMQAERADHINALGLQAAAAKKLHADAQQTGMPPQQLAEGADAAEQAGQVSPEIEQAAVDNVTKETGAPPEPGMWEKLTPGQKWLLGAGLSLAAIGALTSLMDEHGGGLGSTLATVLGGGLALGAAAHGGMLGEDVQNATHAITDPLLSASNMQPVSGDQQRMLAAVRGADLDRYQQMRAGPNPNIPQIA